jgi:hypothetical protein
MCSPCFRCDRLIIPIHQTEPYKHWTVLMVDLQQRRLVFFDSLAGPNPVGPRAMQRVKQWLVDEARVSEQICRHIEPRWNTGCASMYCVLQSSAVVPPRTQWLSKVLGNGWCVSFASPCMVVHRGQLSSGTVPVAVMGHKGATGWLRGRVGGWT